MTMSRQNSAPWCKSESSLTCCYQQCHLLPLQAKQGFPTCNMSQKGRSPLQDSQSAKVSHLCENPISIVILNLNLASIFLLEHKVSISWAHLIPSLLIVPAVQKKQQSLSFQNLDLRIILFLVFPWEVQSLGVPPPFFSPKAVLRGCVLRPSVPSDSPLMDVKRLAGGVQHWD